MTVKGSASHTVSAGKLVFAKGELRVERGAGRYVNRPPFAPYYDAMQKQTALATPSAVARPKR
jgi:dihydropyrimidinase